MTSGPAATPVSSMVFVIVGSFIGSFGAVYLKVGAGRLTRDWRSAVTNRSLIAGVFFYLLSSLFFVLGLRKGELSLLYPLVSAGYIWTMLWSRVFFKEPLTPFKLGGLTLILMGIALLGLGKN